MQRSKNKQAQQVSHQLHLLRLWLGRLLVLLSLSLMISVHAQAQVIEHSSGMCLRTANGSGSPQNGTQVVLSHNCGGDAAQFSWQTGGSIKHLPSNKCVHPGGSAQPSNGTALVLWDGCDFADRVRFHHTGQQSAQQVSSNKCIHPSGGQANPAEGTNLVIWSGCNESRLGFAVNNQPTQPATGVSNIAQLQAAIDTASAGAVIQLSANFSASQAINITKSIVLEGNHHQINHSIPNSGAYAAYTPALIIAASNVIVRNLTIVGDNRHGQNSLIELNNKGATRASNLTVYNVTLKNATAGIRNQGIIPSNLVIENSTFVNLNKAVDLTRDALLSNFSPVWTNLFDGKGERIYYQHAGSLSIRNNSFYVENGQEPMQVGIQIDGGNDGYNPNVDQAPGFPNNTQAARGSFDNLVVKFNQGVIANNSGLRSSDPLRASEFPIALAKVADVTIEENYVETVGISDHQFDFSSGINVEHMSRDITIQDNAVAVNRVVAGDQNNQGISILPYQDHQNNAESEEASVNIKVLNNTFYGAGRSGIFGLAFRNLTLNQNNFLNFTSSRQGLATINLFNTDDNQNGQLDANERATLSGSFNNYGASTNLGANGLVQATLFNTEDPSLLPPHERD